MILHSDPLVGICFGDSRSSIDPKELDFLAFAKAQKLLKFNNLALLKQTHSNNGYIIKDQNNKFFYNKEGDYLITNIKNMGLAVLTADCLPIVFYDVYSLVIGICHAGWKGAIAEIAKNTVRDMQKEFNTDLDKLRVFFGPCAKICCYQVDNNFKENLKNLNFDYYKKTIIKNGNKAFFNLTLFNKLQLKQIGVKRESFHSLYNSCTICDVSFCSYRRDKKNAKRQFTIVSLK